MFISYWVADVFLGNIWLYWRMWCHSWCENSWCKFTGHRKCCISVVSQLSDESNGSGYGIIPRCLMSYIQLCSHGNKHRFAAVCWCLIGVIKVCHAAGFRCLGHVLFISFRFWCFICPSKMGKIYKNGSKLERKYFNRLILLILILQYWL